MAKKKPADKTRIEAAQKDAENERIGGPFTRTPSWGHAAAAGAAALRVAEALMPRWLPAVELDRLERSISALRAFGLDPIRILTEAADGETLYRQSVNSEADAVHLLAGSDDLPLRSPSMQDALFRARNRSEALKKRGTFSDQMGAVIAGRHPAVAAWRRPRNKRGHVLWFEYVEWLSKEIRQIDKGVPPDLFDRGEILDWHTGKKLPPWPGLSGDRVVSVLAYYRTTFSGRKKPYMQMAAAWAATSLTPEDENGARTLLVTWKKAAQRNKGTKR